MPLSTQLDVNLSASYTQATSPPGTGAAAYALPKRYSWLTGVGANQADKIYTVSGTIAASGTATLDLAGSVTDIFGVTVTLVKLKMIMVQAAAANTNNVQLSQPASNGVAGLFSASGTSINVLPGGTLLWVAPNLAAIPVTAATGDLLTLANSSSGSSVTYTVTVVGTSA